MTGFAELVAATNYSFLRGASHPHEIVERAAALGLAAIGIADRNTLAGVVRAYSALRDSGIEGPKPRLVVGARLVTLDGFEVVCHPTDRAAYGRLCRLLTLGNRRAPKGQCHLSFRDILAARHGQIFIAMPPRTADPQPPRAFADRVAALAAACPGNTYLAAGFFYQGDERRRLGLLQELAGEAGAPLVATNDVLYHEPGRRLLADVLTCIREKCTVAEAGLRLETHAERHLKGEAEMTRLLAAHPEAVARTLEIAERTRFSLEELRYEYPEESVPAGRTAQEHLEALAWQGARQRYRQGVPEAVDVLLRKELALIAELDYARYFLTVHDVVRFARSEANILCQGRGSAANSAVCFCLGITSIDPTTTDVLFVRFISADRKEPPDIDVDFEHERREEVIQYLYRRYGRRRAAICATVIHYRPRMAIRQVGRALGLQDDVAAAMADLIWGHGDDKVPDAYISQAGLDPANPRIGRAVGLVNTLIGFPRHLSQHVGGFVLTRERLDESVPVLNAAMEGRTNVEWDKDDIQALGMMKVDVLALGMLTCLRKSLDLIRDHHGRKLTLAEVPHEDSAVYAMLSKADSVGVFQVESRAQMSMLPRLKPQTYYDLVIEVAIVRPGPIQGDMVHPYLRRRDGKEKVTYPSEELKAILVRTLGVPLFQEQAMKIAIVGAGFEPGEADRLRRAMATFRHVGTIHKFQERFVEGMVGRGYDRDFAERCFSQIKGFGDYGFPESHAASFALLAYVSAWVKHHYPEVFCAALLNSQPMGFYQPAQLVRDAREHDVEVLPADINDSQWDCTLEPSRATGARPQAVRLGLRMIQGLAATAAERIVQHRGNGYADPRALWIRSGAPFAALERLADADAFRSMGLDRRAALWAVKGLQGGLTAGRGGRAAAWDRSILAWSADSDLFREPDVDLAPTTLGEHVVEDYAATTLSLKGHPCAFFRQQFARLGVITAREHREEHHKDRPVAVAGLVLARQQPETSKGVIFMTLEDETGVANVVVWRQVFQANRRTVMRSQFLIVRGKVQREGLVVHVVADSFVDLTASLATLRDEDGPTLLHPANTLAAPRRLQRSRDFH